MGRGIMKHRMLVVLVFAFAFFASSCGGNKAVNQADDSKKVVSKAVNKTQENRLPAWEEEYNKQAQANADWICAEIKKENDADAGHGVGWLDNLPPKKAADKAYGLFKAVDSYSFETWQTKPVEKILHDVRRRRSVWFVRAEYRLAKKESAASLWITIGDMIKVSKEFDITPRESGVTALEARQVLLRIARQDMDSRLRAACRRGESGEMDPCDEIAWYLEQNLTARELGLRPKEARKILQRYK